MAAESNKKSDSEDAKPIEAEPVAEPEVKVKAKVGGEDSQPRKRLPRLPRRLPRLTKRRAAGALIVLIITVVGAVLIARYEHVGQKVYAQAAGHKVYGSEIEQIKKGNKKVTDRQAATVLADKYLTEAMAKEDHISVTNQDIQMTYGKPLLAKAKTQPYLYRQKVNQLYLQKLAAFNQSGVYKGEYLIANFSENVPYSSRLLSEQQAGNPNLGNKQAIAADKKYAGNFLTKLYNQIKSGKITWKQAEQKERDDPKVGVKAYPTQPHSGSFDTSDGYGLVVSADATRAKLHKIKQGTTTKPFVAGSSNYLAGPYYLVIRMDVSKGGPNLPFNQFLQQAKQKFDYKVYD